MVDTHAASITDSESSFFVTGGTVPPNAACYVERQADKDLTSALLAGKYCYVLNSRQMGKSSLSVRTLSRLKEAGFRTAFIDLTGIGGSSVTPEQWYAGILAEVGRALGLRKEILSHWNAHPSDSLVVRFFGAIRELALESPIILFFDEIDAVKNLTFSTDEFFAALRECYNRRVQEPDMNRLTICLVGSATPADLIKDTRTSPFNIGYRTDLKDFSRAECAPLAEGLNCQGRGRMLLDRIFFWTNGHPYLTQSLCAAAADAQSATPSDVDKLVSYLFFASGARERNPNLADVANRVVSAGFDSTPMVENRSAMLDLYGKVLRGKPIADDETNRMAALLKLSGITRSENGQLKVRNRIYEQVFDKNWIAAQMPDAELKRQRAAYRTGMRRALAMAAGVLVVVTSLAVAAYRSSRIAIRERDKARVASSRERDSRQAADERLYIAELSLASQALESGNLARAREILENHRSNRAVRDLRDFAWRYLWGQCRTQERSIIPVSRGEVWVIALSPDGKQLAAGGRDREIRIIELASRRIRCILRGHSGHIGTLAFSEDGRRLISSGDEGVIVWDVSTGRRLASIGIPRQNLTCSPDGSLLAIVYGDGAIWLWDAREIKRLAQLRGPGDSVSALRFSPDSLLLASGHRSDPIRVWDVRSRRIIRTLKGHHGWVNDLGFSPDGNTLAAAVDDSSVRLWNLKDGSALAALKGHHGSVSTVAFSPDGRHIASSGADGTVRIWKTDEKTQWYARSSASGEMYLVAFSAKSHLIASGGQDGAVHIWDWNPEGPAKRTATDGIKVWTAAYSPDGKYTAVSYSDSRNQGELSIRDRTTGKQIAHVGGVAPMLHNIAFLPDNRTIAFAPGMGGEKRGIRLWNWRTGKIEALPSSHTAWHIAASPDGRWIAQSTGSTNTIVRWDVRTHAGNDMGSHSAPVSAMAFSPDSHRLVSGASNGEIFVWNFEDGKLEATIQSQIPNLRAIAFSPGGDLLAAAGESQVISLWETHAWNKSPDLRTSSRGIQSLAFSWDGANLASAGVDGLVLIWNVKLRQQALALAGQHESITSVAFSRDGNALLAAGAESVWDFEAPALAQIDSQRGFPGETVFGAVSPPGSGKPDMGDPFVHAMRTASAIPATAEMAAFRKELIAQGYILDWLILGPVPFSTDGNDVRGHFDLKHTSDIVLSHPREGMKATVEGTSKSWTAYHSPTALTGLRNTLGVPAVPVTYNSQIAGYLCCYIDSPVDLPKAIIVLGHIGGERTYVNGKSVHLSTEAGLPTEGGLDVIRAPIRRGINSIVLQTAWNIFYKDWGASVRVLDDTGKPVPGLKSTLSSK